MKDNLSTVVNAAATDREIETHTVHGPRGPRVHVRIRPVEAEPGRDAGPRTCLTVSLTRAERFGALLQDVARTGVVAVGTSK